MEPERLIGRTLKEALALCALEGAAPGIVYTERPLKPGAAPSAPADGRPAVPYVIKAGEGTLVCAMFRTALSDGQRSTDEP